MAEIVDSNQWREAAHVLRSLANKWDALAERAERGEGICGVVSDSGTNGEPLACAFPKGHSSNHAWATLPTFIRTAESAIRKAKGYE